MDNIIQELLECPIHVNYIDYRELKEPSLNSNHEFFRYEEYHFKDLISFSRLKEGPVNVNPIFLLRIRNAFQSEFSKCLTFDDVDSYLVAFNGRVNHLKLDCGNLIVKDHRTPVEELGITDLRLNTLIPRQLKKELALEKFENRKPEIAKHLGQKLSRFLLHELSAFCQSQEFQKIREALKPPLANKKQKPSSRPLKLKGIPPNKEEDFKKELHALLKSADLLEEECSIKEFKGIFLEKEERKKINWTGSKQSLRLFVKNLPISNRQYLIDTASLFSVKGERVDQEKLHNTHSTPSTDLEWHLFNALEALVKAHRGK